MPAESVTFFSRERNLGNRGPSQSMYSGLLLYAWTERSHAS